MLNGLLGFCAAVKALGDLKGDFWGLLSAYRFAVSQLAAFWTYISMKISSRGE